jgi:hypothetical protein
MDGSEVSIIGLSCLHGISGLCCQGHTAEQTQCPAHTTLRVSIRTATAYLFPTRMCTIQSIDAVSTAQAIAAGLQPEGGNMHDVCAAIQPCHVYTIGQW